MTLEEIVLPVEHLGNNIGGLHYELLCAILYIR
jgi:hypothetical protein